MRSETAETQSISIGQTMSLDMKLLLHGNDMSRPVEFSIAVEPEITFKSLKSLIAPPDNQFLVVKGQEWKMDEYGRICDDWSTNELVAIFEKINPNRRLSNSNNYSCCYIVYSAIGCC